MVSLIIEKSVPFLLAFCTVIVTIFVPISISTFYTLHTTGAKIVLSGKHAETLQNKYDNTYSTIEGSIKLYQRQPDLLRGIKGQPGRKGAEGSEGTKGSKGRKGSSGSKGDQGQKGNAGRPGDRSIKGSKGEKGERGEGSGPKGDVGPKGDRGEKGNKVLEYREVIFPKDTGYLEGSKHSYKGYVVFCEGPCKEVTAKLKYARGDPDLYGREGSPPDITSSDSDCNDCPDCRSRAGGGTEDKCTFTIDGDIFYLVVWGHGEYSKAKLVIGGMNFKTAKECRDRECGDIEENKPLS